MAEAEDKPDEVEEGAEGEAEGGEQQAKGGKGPLKLLLAVGLLIATGGALAVMAIPGKEKEYLFEGPFFGKLFQEPITVTVQDAEHTRYIKFETDAEFVAYDAAYFATRMSDPFYLPYLRSKAEMVGSSRTVGESAAGPERELFAAALRTALDPIVFPVHIGATKNPLDQERDTGLRPGVSHNDATFRGRFHDHVLKFDGPGRILQLDDGPEATFKGDEDDLELRTAFGDVLYLDLTHFDPDHVGEVKVGVHGKLRHIVLSAIGQ